MLGELTHIPTQVYGVLWISVALGVAFLLLKRAYKDA